MAELYACTSSEVSPVLTDYPYPGGDGHRLAKRPGARLGRGDHRFPAGVADELADRRTHARDLARSETGEAFPAKKSRDPKVQERGPTERLDDPHEDADPARRIALSHLHHRQIGRSLLSIDHSPFRRQSIDVVIDHLDGCEFSLPKWHRLGSVQVLAVRGARIEFEAVSRRHGDRLLQIGGVGCRRVGPPRSKVPRS
jgi:hypothetical protein